MADGTRSLLAPWMGGAGNGPATTFQGYRSVHAFWMGGGATASTPAGATGRRGMLAFWMGGAGNDGAAPPAVIATPRRGPFLATLGRLMN